jgi:uncharacterized protein YjbI with pentapeptide repeats
LSYKSKPLSELVPLHHKVRQLPRRYPKVTVALLALVLVLGLVSAGYEAPWSGFGDKTLWDWLDLLIVPVVLGVGGYLFTRTENRSSLAIAEQRAQDETLQSYIDQMSQLIIEHGLRGSNEDDDASVSARARTLAALERLDGARKASLLRFLYEAGLIDKGARTVRLQDADLTGVQLFSGIRVPLRPAKLLNAALPGVDLTRADLRLAVLAGSDLEGAIMSEIDGKSVHLEQSNLTGATLFEADLGGAWLARAQLTGANIRRARLSQANLEGSNLGNTSCEFSDTTILNDADLSKAKLMNADLTGATFVRASLIEADLTGANLAGVSLQDADLTGATVTDEQLEACACLEGAVMPNGLLSDGSMPDKRQQ